MSKWFPNFRKLFSGKIGTENKKLDIGGNNTAPIAQGKQCVAMAIHVSLPTPEKKQRIELSDEEKRLLSILSCGATIGFCINENREVDTAFLIGITQDKIDNETITKLLPEMFKKGLLDRRNDVYEISARGRQYVIDNEADDQ